MSAQQGQAPVADGAELRVGDRVVVVECDRAPSSFYPIGATGTVKRIDCDGDYWIDFDAGFRVKKRADGSRTWCAIPERLRKMTAPKNSGKLADVLALVEKATPGEWVIQAIPEGDDEFDAAARAAVNYLRTHGRAIAGLVEAMQHIADFTAYQDCDNCNEMNAAARAALRAMGETQ